MRQLGLSQLIPSPFLGLNVLDHDLRSGPWMEAIYWYWGEGILNVQMDKYTDITYPNKH